jgi:UDP-galactose transporter B1
MSSSGGALRLFACVAGIFTFYLYYGIAQERVYKEEADGSRFSSVAFMLLAQCVMNATFAGIGGAIYGALFAAPSSSSSEKKKDLSAPAAGSAPGYLRALCGTRLTGHTWMCFISLFYVAAMGCSNQALQYVNYPTQALGKSCKMIPIMLFNVLFNGTRYSWVEYLSAVFITSGIVVFRIFKASTKAVGANSSFGLMLLVASLCLDGLTASNQKVYRAKYSSPTIPGALRMMMHTNLWACLHVGALALYTGQLVDGAAYIQSHPELLWPVLVFALCSACGQFFIFLTITGPGPLVCTTITTTRKFFTILLSVLMNPENSLTGAQWGGVALVFGGLSGELAKKYASKGKKKAAHTL